MKQVDSTLTGRLTDTLGRHAALDVQRNPVLLRAGRLTGEVSPVARVLGQYSLLPATIVEFLKIGKARLARWEEVREELGRNIDEELGSRTDGQTHYEILTTAAGRELGLSLADVEPMAATEEFLDDIRLSLHKQPQAYVAGVLFALEASAVPELTVVASVINEYAALTGSAESPIILSETDWKPSELSGRRTEHNYTLNEFFAAHLFDFEVGHRNRLAETLANYLVSPGEEAKFAEGFGSVLHVMDGWWEALAEEIRVQESQPLLTVARRRIIVPLSGNIFLPHPEFSR